MSPSDETSWNFCKFEYAESVENLRWLTKNRLLCVKLIFLNIVSKLERKIFLSDHVFFLLAFVTFLSNILIRHIFSPITLKSQNFRICTVGWAVGCTWRTKPYKKIAIVVNKHWTRWNLSAYLRCLMEHWLRWINLSYSFLWTTTWKARRGRRMVSWNNLIVQQGDAEIKRMRIFEKLRFCIPKVPCPSLLLSFPFRWWGSTGMRENGGKLTGYWPKITGKLGNWREMTGFIEGTYLFGILLRFPQLFRTLILIRVHLSLIWITNYTCTIPFNTATVCADLELIENDLCIISRALTSQLDQVQVHEVKRLLKDLGVKMMTPHDLVHNIIIPIFKSGKWKVCILHWHKFSAKMTRTITWKHRTKQ